MYKALASNCCIKLLHQGMCQLSDMQLPANPLYHAIKADRQIGMTVSMLFISSAGTPSWVVDRRDSPEERFNNHNWVEVWDGSWSFTGQ